MRPAALASDQNRPLPTPAAAGARPAQAQTGIKSRGEAADEGGLGFLDVLSMLNPLQYLPVIGSIYRAATGDTIPETVRTVGSLVVSGLLGGPVGVAVCAATTAFMNLVGFDPDKMAHTALASVGLVSDPKDGPKRAALEAPADAAGAEVSWSRAQRAAYGLAVDDALSPARSFSAGPHDSADHVRRLATAAYARSNRAVASAPGRSPIVSLAA